LEREGVETIKVNPAYTSIIGRYKYQKQFWTDPDKMVCPDNTVVQMNLFGVSGTDHPALNVPPFAEGVVTTKGSVYDNWIVTLQGSNQ
jgi:hypothetical protein